MPTGDGRPATNQQFIYVSKTRTLFVALLVVIPAFAWSQDLLMLRSGDEIFGKVDRVSKTEAVMNIAKECRPYYDQMNGVARIPVSDLYMIKYKERGNVYFNEDGTRITGENRKLDKTANLIYLTTGREIPAWDVNFGAQEVSYSDARRDGKRTSIASDEIFLIKYIDGSKDIITSIEKKEPVEEKKETDNTPQFKVIFHTVQQGETIASIAEKYGVTNADIREWNEFSPKQKDNGRLPVGKQLMIQQPIK